jgi:bifunctional non-homologous end joining protein LigD
MADRKKATFARRKTPKALDTIRSAPRAELPALTLPRLAMLVDKPPAGGRWLHQIKLDGYRTAARIETGLVQMLTRKGLDWTKRFGPIARALPKLSVRGAI